MKLFSCILETESAYTDFLYLQIFASSFFSHLLTVINTTYQLVFATLSTIFRHTSA